MHLHAHIHTSICVVWACTHTQTLTPTPSHHTPSPSHHPAFTRHHTPLTSSVIATWANLYSLAKYAGLRGAERDCMSREVVSARTTFPKATVNMTPHHMPLPPLHSYTANHSTSPVVGATDARRHRARPSVGKGATRVSGDSRLIVLRQGSQTGHRE